ncbi:retroviral-like aspartic protease family protein [candidate division KSB1 bacterium]|nr:retroviral-like aspartic protease family protein [candidate division KSB1 bacterium]
MPQLEFGHQLNYRPLLVETGGRKELTIPPPVIEVTFLHSGLTTSDFAIIDSGSTFSLFSREIADELGIAVLQGRTQKLTTLGGPILVYGHEVTIKIVPNFQYKTEILFSEYPIPRNLLGHNGFLNQMAIALRSKFGLIYLNPEA